MSNTGVYHLFVYGSLRKGFHSDAYGYISRYFTFVGPAKVKGKLFDMGSYPAAIPANEESYIIGELYKIKDESEFSWAIGQLDDYEGVTVEQGETQLYRRELAEAISGDQKIIAWLYWFNGSVDNRPLITSGDVLQYLQDKK